MRRVSRSLARAFEDGQDREARLDMSFAALLGGLSLANAGLGVVHGFAAPIGGSFEAPHGAVCAALLPHGMAANIRACRERAPHLLERFAAVARLLTGNDHAAAEDGVEWVRRLVESLLIPPLGRYGITEGDLPDLVEKAAKASSMRANPLPLEDEELYEVVCAAL
jgi:alcohol dehydrogenase class IV